MIDKDHQSPVGEPLCHGLVEGGLGLDVKPGPGLIKDEQPRAGQERLRDSDLLRHSL